MDFTKADIGQFMENIWGSTLQMPLTPVEGREETLRDGLVASVRITGTWHGEVALTCTRPFAERAATVMFATEKAQLAETDLNDAVTELANIVAGQLKALVAAPSKLSLPCLDSLHHDTAPEGTELDRSIFDCLGDLVQVTVRRLGEEVPLAA